MTFLRSVAALALVAGMAGLGMTAGAPPARAQDSTLLGTGVGGAAGAGIGYGLGGAKGAAVGGILGLGVGALSGHLYGKKDEPPPPPPAPAYYAPPPPPPPGYAPAYAPPPPPPPGYAPAYAPPPPPPPGYAPAADQGYQPPPPAYAPPAPAVAGAGYDTSYCRQYSKTTTIGGQQYTSTGTACRQPDGTWREVN